METLLLPKPTLLASSAPKSATSIEKAAYPSSGPPLVTSETWYVPAGGESILKNLTALASVPLHQ